VAINPVTDDEEQLARRRQIPVFDPQHADREQWNVFEPTLNDSQRTPNA